MASLKSEQKDLPFFTSFTLLSNVFSFWGLIIIPSNQGIPADCPISSPSLVFLHGNGMPCRSSPPFWVEVADAVLSGRWQEQCLYRCPEMLRKGVQTDQFRTPHCWRNLWWKVVALPKQSEKCPSVVISLLVCHSQENQKDAKEQNLNSRATTWYYMILHEGAGFGHLLSAPS